MAIRPHGGGGGNRGMPSGSGRGGGHRGGELDIFGGSSGGGLFGGRDPFAEFGSFGGGDAFGGGGLGGGFGGGFGSMMQRFDDMSRDMGGGMGQGGGGPGGGAMRGMSGGNGQYAMQSFAMSSHMGPDGKMHTERFSSSDVGNREQKVREAQQAYSNSSTKQEKMGLERQLGDRARKVVKERCGHSGEERSTEMFRGMDESHAGAFDRDFGSMAHHMPAHPRDSGRMMQIMQGGGGGGGGRSSLPGGRGGQGGGRQMASLDSRPSSGGRSSAGGRQHSMPANYARRR